MPHFGFASGATLAAATAISAYIAIPPSIKAEHDEIHAELVAATKAPGRVGEAGMLKEHQAIHAATVRLGDVARGEGNTAVARLAEKLALHARAEEEVFYPAALLVGEIVRARLSTQ